MDISHVCFKERRGAAGTFIEHLFFRYRPAPCPSSRYVACEQSYGMPSIAPAPCPVPPIVHVLLGHNVAAMPAHTQPSGSLRSPTIVLTASFLLAYLPTHYSSPREKTPPQVSGAHRQGGAAAPGLSQHGGRSGRGPRLPHSRRHNTPAGSLVGRQKVTTLGSGALPCT